jgi:hypothetical protein
VSGRVAWGVSGGDYNRPGRHKWCHSRCCGIDRPPHATIDFNRVSRNQETLRRGRPAGRSPLSTMPRAHDEQPQGRRSTPWQSAVTTGNPERARGAQHGEYDQCTSALLATPPACCSTSALTPAWQPSRSHSLSSRRGACGWRYRRLGHGAARSSSGVCARGPRYGRSAAATPAISGTISYTARRATPAGRRLTPKASPLSTPTLPTGAPVWRHLVTIPGCPVGVADDICCCCQLLESAYY